MPADWKVGDTAGWKARLESLRYEHWSNDWSDNSSSPETEGGICLKV